MSSFGHQSGSTNGIRSLDTTITSPRMMTVRMIDAYGNHHTTTVDCRDTIQPGTDHNDVFKILARRTELLRAELAVQPACSPHCEQCRE